jgi:hypothetical protein
MVTEAITTARAAGAPGDCLVRGDSAYGTSAVVQACFDAGARFSVVLTQNRAVTPRSLSRRGHRYATQCVHRPEVKLPELE